MTVSHGRQAVRPVGPGVLVVAYADQRELEQPDHRGEYLSPRQAGEGEVAPGVTLHRVGGRSTVFPRAILRQWRDNAKIRAALSNSFGFGGTNAALVFKHPDA